MLLILADKLNGYDERDIRELCTGSLGLSEPENLETTSRILMRWLQLDRATRERILRLIAANSIEGEETDFTMRIAMAIKNVKPKEPDQNKGWQAVA